MSNPDRNICFSCQNARCAQCVDVLAAVFDNPNTCQCTRVEHSGEPNRNQILDPETQAVHAPDLVVEQTGEVKRNG